MTQIEMEVVRSQIRANNAIAWFANVNWEQRRYEIAKSIMPFCAKATCDLLTRGYPLDEYKGKTVFEAIAIQATRYADALIEELKKDKQ